MCDLSPDELGAWLRLAHLTGVGVGRATVRRLLAALGSPQAVVSAPLGTLQAVVGPGRADNLFAEPADPTDRLDKTLAWLGAAPGRRVLTLADADYPSWLLEAPDPPVLLYLEGRVDLLSARSVAIVGSRRPTPQGLETARQLARELGEHGWTVVSGLAAGIDGAAHAGALETPASTIAVVGTGLDIVYPHAHRALASRMARHGLLVSEFPLGTSPLQTNFPQRNRIIAGLTRGTLVVEAALRSGSLITARQALEAGREVFAVPGSILSAQSRGCHALLKDGARLVESIEDILDELTDAPVATQAPVRPNGPQGSRRPVSGSRARSTAVDGAANAAGGGGGRGGLSGSGCRSGNSGDDGDAQRDGDGHSLREGEGNRLGDGHDHGTAEGDRDEVLQALGHDPVSLDALIARSGWSAPALNVRLMELELEGRVARLPGGLFQRQQAA